VKGLISQSKEPSPAAMPSAEAEGIDDAEALQGNASSEEEQVMEAALEEVGNLIYSDDNANNALMNGISQASNPVEMIGINAAQIIEVVDRKMDLPDDFLLPLVEPVVVMLVEMADAAGILVTDDAVIEQALTEGAAQLAQAYEIDPQDLQQFAGDPELSQAISDVGGMYAGQG
jgi:hypothetical protein